MQGFGSSGGCNTPACDTHVHVFDPARFAYAPQRRFTPGPATVTDLVAYLTRMTLDRVVLVQPSVYGSDHACLLDALRTLNEQGIEARGIAVIDTSITDPQIAALDAAGVVGARINLAVNHSGNAADQQLVAAKTLLDLADHCTPAHWHIQWHLHLRVLHRLKPLIVASRRAHVLDHLGLPDLSAGIGAPDWQGLLDMLQNPAGGRFYVKTSAPYLLSTRGPDHSDLNLWLSSLLNVRPDRLLWGSNWPHTQGTGRSQTQPPSELVDSHPAHSVEPFRQVDERPWLTACTVWAGDKADSLLGGNAQRLYGFTDQS